MRSPLRTLGALRNKVPTPYVSGRNLAFPWTQLTGAEAQMRAMGSVGTLFSIVNRTSTATALVDWKLWRKAPSGLKEDRTEVTAHAALDLWNKPNPFMTREELVEVMQQHVDLTGEGWLTVAYNGARSAIPLELWPVRPDRMMPIPHPTEFLTGYEYTGPAGEKIPLRKEDVIFLRTPNPLDIYRGMGAVQSILIDLDSTRASAEWNQAFFRNSAEPGGVIELDSHLTDDEFAEMTTRWQEQHQGVSNAHRVAVLERGAKWVERKFTQRDMQFVELRRASREIIREAFGVPAFVLGEVGDVNRATAEASMVMFAQLLTIPRLERIKHALNNDLLPLYGRSTARALEFDYEDPVPQDAAARNAELTTKTAAAKNLIDAGGFGPEVLASVGLPEVSFGDPDEDEDRNLLIKLVTSAPSLAPLILPLLGFELGAADETETEDEPAATPPPPPAPAARLDIHHHAAQPTARATTAPRPVLPAVRAQEEEGADAEEVREPLDDALDELLEQWEPIAEAQYEELGEQIRKAVDKGDTAALADLTVDTADASDVLRKALAGMAEDGVRQMLAEAAEQGVKVRKPQLSKRVKNAFGSELLEVAQATATLLGSDVAASAGREALRRFTPGAVGRDIADGVTEFLRGLKNFFRRDQLGGALHRAQNQGRLAVLEAAPTARYFATERNDKNVCAPCREIDDTEFEDLAAAQAAYATGGYQECLGGVRCRGTYRAVWDQEGED